MTGGWIVRVVVALCVGLATLAVVPQAAAATRDRKPPRVTVLKPSIGQTASGALNVSGTARDNVKVRKVEISVDGGPFRRAKGKRNWSAAIDTSTYGDGAHTLVVRATDTSGRRTKVSVPVEFANDQPAPAPSGPSSTTTAEGTTVDVDSAGPWTATQIAQMLQDNGLDGTVGPRLTVKVQDTYASQLTSATTSSGGSYTSFTATMYLKGVNSSFATTPDATLAHEYGHAWSLYHLYMSRGGDWTSYLQARGLADHPKLDTSYSWDRAEIIAEDYRLLFGSAEAIGQRPQHLNAEIADPRDVAGLRTFLAEVWTA